MSDDQGKLSHLREQLNGNQAERWSALRELDDLDNYSWKFVRELTPTVVEYLLDSESNTLERDRASSAFEAFIEAKPSAVAASIGNRSEFIPEENESIIETVLEALDTLEENNPGFLAGEELRLSYLTESRSKDIRYHATLLHGAIATRDALRQLEHVLNHVGDDAARAGAYDGFNRAVERITMSLSNREIQPLDIETAADSLLYVADNRPSLLENRWSQVLHGLRTSSHETVADALIKIVTEADKTEHVAHELTDIVLEMVEENVQSAVDVAASTCEEVPAVAQTIADHLPAPSETEIESLVSSVPSGTDGHLLTGLLSERHQDAAVAGLKSRIEAGSVDPEQVSNASVDLMAHQPTSDEAAELLVCTISSYPETMEDVFPSLYSRLEPSLRTDGSRELSASARVLEAYAEVSPTIANKLVDDILTRVFPERGEYPESLQDILETSCESHPGTIVDRVEQVTNLLTVEDKTTRVQGLDLLGSALHSDTPEAVDALPAILDCLEDPDPTVRGRAVQTIVEMGVEPAPPELQTLVDDDSAPEELRNRASQAITTIEQTDNTGTVERTYSKTGAAILEGDQGGVGLRRWSSEAGWEPIDFGEFRRGLITEIRKQRHRSPGVGLPVLLPYYEPSEVVLFALDFVLREPSDDCQVVLFSPGTQTQWGQKKEIRKELSQYGLALRDDSPLIATRLPDVVPHAHISGGEPKLDSKGSGPGTLVITKYLDELLTLSPNQVDAVVFHLCSRRREEWGELLEEADEQFDGATTLTVFSHFVKNEREHGRPSYGPPQFLERVSTLPSQDVVDSATATEENGPSDGTLSPTEWTIGDSDLVGRRETPTIRIVEIDAAEIGSLLEQVFDASAALEDVDDEGGSYRIFSEQMFYERLPAPVSEYDEWILEEWEAGAPERYLPSVSEERLSRLHEFGGQVENKQVPKRVFDAEQKLRRIRDKLKDSSPMFDALVTRVRDAIRQEERIAIFVSTPSFEGVLRRAFEHQSEMEIERGDSSLVSIVTPDTARKIEPVQTLLIPGPVHPQHKCYYVHPRAEVVEVLTYSRLWSTMVERHAEEHVELLNDTIAVQGYRPFENPDLAGDLEPEEGPESEGPAPVQSAIEGGTPSDHPLPEDTRKTKMELLTSAMETASQREYSDSSSRYVDEYRTYRIKLEDGTTLTQGNTDTVLRYKSDDSLHWVRPQLLGEGDSVVVIPRDLKQELWRERLHKLYDEEISPSAVDDLTIWHRRISKIWTETANEFGGEPSNREIIDEIYQKSKSEGLERRRGTVGDWLKSVQSADDPLELAENPSLTIGPQNQDDIRVVGEAFNDSALTDGYEDIESAMRGLRTVNRNEGREFHDWLREQLLNDESNRVSESAHTEEVVSVKDITTHNKQNEE